MPLIDLAIKFVFPVILAIIVCIGLWDFAGDLIGNHLGSPASYSKSQHMPNKANGMSSGQILQNNGIATVIKRG